ncbi:MAG TPA: LuxR C-terminal-related transcriptional regulator [Caproiciproducens sp.]|nr:LuxR C-terminal-related transcriptional regulator [Caproiciproducens sp.]
MSAGNFDNDKFMPTPLPEICAPRNELLDLYNRAAESRLTVVCAPAGYGKTVSTLLWVKNSGRKSVWIGLDEYDNAPFVFYKLLCTGILSVQPDNLKMLEIINSQAFYSSPVENTIDLLLEFAQNEQSYVLILDDLHTIINKEILKSLPFILKRMPHSFDIIILSRNSLPEEFTEFFESRNGILITANELAFTAQEIQDYYRALGHSMTKKQAQSVFDATDGWAIGINALSKSEHFEAPEGSGQILENYINKNIWEKWDTDLREFMLKTSVADEMNAELCEILTGEENATGLLDKLVVQNLFVVKTSESTYRYHHLFSEFLRDKLKEHPDADVQGLCLKVADFYFKRQNIFKALAYYVRAESNDGINKCYFQLNSGFLDFSVEEWLHYFTVFVLDKLPEEFTRNNISLVYESAWSNYMNGNAEAALRYIDIANDYIVSEQNLNRMKENNFLGFFCTMWFVDFRKGICEYTEDFSTWMKTLPDQNQDSINIYTPTITLNFPFMHRSFRDCLEIVVDMDNRLQAIKEVFGNFFPKEIEVLCCCVKAGLYYELNMLEKAQEAILFAQSELKKGHRFEIQFCVFMLSSQIFSAMGKAKNSESIRKRFSERIKEENALYLNPNFLAIDTKFKLWDADREAAKAWLEQLFVTDDEPLHFYKLYQYFTTVRAYIVLSERDKATEYLEKLKKLGSDYRRPLDVAEAGVLQAVIEWATGSKKEAAQTLEKVLLLMQPYRAVRIIADEGESVLPILKKITVKVGKADYDGRLDGHYLNQVLLCAYEVSKRQKGIAAYINRKPVKLSKQQKYILILLSQGYKNAEIIEMTGLTINTIRSYTKIVYQKLGVSKAADAVIEAKKLGIIQA